ncbi:Crp/Fnr family transcriptional regulator [Thalassolituus maritimus]|uniref:Crp/Fnr family transcriptional regulator n=1 Tax=Thalassolituus maritimus TaxID=484498 RepID=UPI00333EAB24
MAQQVANSQASWLNRSYRNPKFTTSTATKYRPHDAALRSLAGKEVIYRLMTDGSMVLGYSGFITGKPATEDIECLQECSGFWIRIRDLEGLRDSNPAIDRIYRYLAEQHYLTMERRLMMLHHKSAEQRYRFFLEHMSPKIVSATPMNCIASYLGVTAESFSRMKKTFVL